MLDDFQAALYDNLVNVWRDSSTARDASGNPTGATEVIVGLVCKLFTTPNFDQKGVGGTGQSKEQNIMTSDVLRCDIGADLRMGDYVKITQGPMVGQWRKVAGIENSRAEIANYAEVYLSLSVCPKGGS